MLTAKQKYVGIYEARDDVGDLVQDHVNGNVHRGHDVNLDGASWRVYTGSVGDYALARTVAHAGSQEAQLVVGTAPTDAQAEQVRQSLLQTRVGQGLENLQVQSRSV